MLRAVGPPAIVSTIKARLLSFSPLPHLTILGSVARQRTEEDRFCPKTVNQERLPTGGSEAQVLPPSRGSSFFLVRLALLPALLRFRCFMEDGSEAVFVLLHRARDLLPLVLRAFMLETQTSHRADADARLAGLPLLPSLPRPLQPMWSHAHRFPPALPCGRRLFSTALTQGLPVRESASREYRVPCRTPVRPAV